MIGHTAKHSLCQLCKSLAGIRHGPQNPEAAMVALLRSSTRIRRMRSAISRVTFSSLSLDASLPRDHPALSMLPMS
jgi:hypothetical protein